MRKTGTGTICCVGDNVAAENKRQVNFSNAETLERWLTLLQEQQESLRLQRCTPSRDEPDHLRV